jgi:acyl dehydratase
LKLTSTFQESDFVAPAKIGDTLTAVVEVAEIMTAKKSSVANSLHRPGQPGGASLRLTFDIAILESNLDLTPTD